MTLFEKQKGVFISDSIIDSINSSNGIIFDCDGVLIDVTQSYDLAIIKTTKYVLENLFDIPNALEITSKIIDGFKATGGFNDEVDLTYASIISLYTARKLKLDERDFIFKVIENCDSSGIISAEKYIQTKTQINEVKDKLSYPGTHHENPLYKIFDQIFYGPTLYKKLFKIKSEFNEPGLIENDSVILTPQLIFKLKEKYKSKIAIVSGRGKESVKFSLKNLLDEFDLEHSAFLEDEPREMAKPSPKSLARCINGMNCNTCLYVGDSMEDLIMAKKVTEDGLKTIFCGIIGTSKNPQKKLEIFEKNGASLVIESINLLPKVLNLE
jgi:HAD superfamily hydrolase (TIGR01549 family)